MTTTEEISTVAIPADCPALQDCPFESCTYGRKYDNHGCPTCNCLHSSKSNETCPTLTCQACPYGHHTDVNGVNTTKSKKILSIELIFSVPFANVKLDRILH